MRSSFLDFAARKTFFLSSILIGLIIFLGTLLTAKYYTNQLASLTAGSCYLQSEIDAKASEKISLENKLADTQDQIDDANKGITDNWTALTLANQEVERITPTIVSDYTINQKTEEVNTLYSQLTSSKSIDSIYSQMQEASKNAATTKTAYLTLYSQVQASYNLTISMQAKANAARISSNPATRRTYPALLSQYNTQLTKYNSLKNQYTSTLAKYNTYSSQYTTLSSQYTTLSAQYRSKYGVAYTASTTATLQTQYDALNSSYQKLVADNNNAKSQITKLNESITTYKTKDAELNKLVSDLALALSILKNQIRDLETVIATYKTNICPVKELICNDNIDNNRNGTQDCDDLDCKGSVACQVGGSCGDSVCSAGENHDNCPQDCEASTSSVVKYFPPYGADTDSGIEELTITFPYDINYSGGTVSIYENGVVSGVGISVSSSTSRKIILSLANTLEPGKFYSINANLDIGDGNMWTGGWGFRAVGGDGGGSGGGDLEICGNGIDDDGNGFTDCADARCSTIDACKDNIDCSDVANCNLSACSGAQICTDDNSDGCSPVELRKIDLEGELYRRYDSLVNYRKSGLSENSPEIKFVLEEIEIISKLMPIITIQDVCDDLDSTESSLNQKKIEADYYLTHKQDV